MEKKERKGRRAYLDDFRRTVDGEYIYIGATYAFQGEQSTRKRGLLRWGILAVGMVACAIVGGCIRAPGTVNCAYVLIPYAVGILAAFSVLWGYARMAKGGDPLRAYVYEATVPHFPLRTILTAVGGGGAILGELIYVILNGVQGLLVGMIVFLVSQAAMLVCALLWRPLGREMSWERFDGAGWAGNNYIRLF